MEYPKIHSLFKRDPETHRFLDEVSCEEFYGHSEWRVEEKIDGMNIRIYIDGPQGIITDIKGRTDNAMIPPKLLKYFKNNTLFQNYSKILFLNGPAILFGEGFGADIQSGGIYRKDMAFILFDCYFSDRWSTREEIYHMGPLLGFDTPHDYGIMSISEIIKMIKSKPNGMYGSANYLTEGIIARSHPLVRFNDRSANPVLWKLKVKDLD